jgi:hypothetical protein
MDGPIFLTLDQVLRLHDREIDSLGGSDSSIRLAWFLLNHSYSASIMS